MARGMVISNHRISSLSSIASAPRQVSANFNTWDTNSFFKGKTLSLCGSSPSSHDLRESHYLANNSFKKGEKVDRKASAYLECPVVDPNAVYVLIFLRFSVNQCEYTQERPKSVNEWDIPAQSFLTLSDSGLLPKSLLVEEISRPSSPDRFSQVPSSPEDHEETEEGENIPQKTSIVAKGPKNNDRVDLNYRVQRRAGSSVLISDSESEAEINSPPRKIQKISESENNFGKIEISYGGISLLQTEEWSRRLTNTARRLPQQKPNGGVLVRLLNQSDCKIKRVRYIRSSLDVLDGLQPDVYYIKNLGFSENAPYQQEFTRVENTRSKKQKRCGLCPYCKELSFFELKTSSYSQHMCHTHGVLTSGYLTPDPILLGRYKVSKPVTMERRTIARPRERECVVCPVCYEVIEVRCWKSKVQSNPYSNYLRHFKAVHRGSLNRQQYFNVENLRQ